MRRRLIPHKTESKRKEIPTRQHFVSAVTPQRPRAIGVEPDGSCGRRLPELRPALFGDRGHQAAANARLFEYELEAQFRCVGFEGFVNWVDTNTLGIARTANMLWDPSGAFDFQIVPSVEVLDAAIR